MENQNDNICDDENFRISDERDGLLQDQSYSSSTQNLLADSRNMEPKKRPQILTAIAACLGAMAMGSVLGFASPAGPIFLSGIDGINLTSSQNDWVSSSVTIGALVGGPAAGLVIGTLGRRMTMIATLLPYMIGWGFIISGMNFAMLLIGRLICGLSVGFTSVTVPTYIGEIASPNIRGTIASTFQLMVTIGVLYGFSIGPAFDSFRLIALVCAIPPVIHGVAIIFCKESPLYLLMKNMNHEAAEALQFLRGSNYDIGKEIRCMTDSIEEAKRNKVTLMEMKEPYIIKPFIISILLMVFQQFSGINAVLFNLGIIFQEAGTSVNHNVAAIIIGLVQVVVTVVSMLLIDRLGRRILLQISSLFMSISLVPLGVFFYMQSQVDGADEAQALIDNLGWIPITSLVCFITAFSIGYGPIPWIMMAEMFFPNVKDLAVSVATTSNWLCAFITTVTFGTMSNTIGSHGVYWFFAGICAINFAFCCLIVPETKGKTVEEITELFGRRVNIVRRN